MRFSISGDGVGGSTLTFILMFSAVPRLSMARPSYRAASLGAPGQRLLYRDREYHERSLGDIAARQREGSSR
jgi:hypothetical protein